MLRVDKMTGVGPECVERMAGIARNLVKTSDEAAPAPPP